MPTFVFLISILVLSVVYLVYIYLLSHLICEGCGDVTALSPLWDSGYWTQSQLQGTAWTSRQLIAGSLLMAEATMQDAKCTSVFGVQYLVQGYFDMQLSAAQGEPGFEP